MDYVCEEPWRDSVKTTVGFNTLTGDRRPGTPRPKRRVYGRASSEPDTNSSVSPYAGAGRTSPVPR